ncbi:serine hydrolase domain-containing protein [Roseateles asaccharophilus]|uniref:CubicO group peptidase (Beta-lactamase class C family) n=1 Tax=Roseateles asaccharophilus TaxID=582607 RepID=A0ABU2A7Z2_9BURK|nr:serine hydrolase domain-containing protein [Roseateles asaccharophilus]MDR7333140.1 CubicO group peptidase (beta-lactamase class C family) [Roseateles asaccharophilus]
MTRHLFAALTCLPMLAMAVPASDADVEKLLADRFDSDRSGACVQAAVIEPGKVWRATRCAGTRKDGAPAAGAAFEIGSVTKTMTAALVAGLIDAGRWSLDDPVARHLPEGTVVPRQGERQILVRDLVTHTSGLPALPPGLSVIDPANPYASLTEAQVLAALKKVQLTRPIGSQPEYSNFGMLVLSMAVARSHGGDLEGALREQLFKPLGMNTAYIAKPLGAAPAMGHLPDGTPTPAWTIATNLAGVGMVKATLDDMVRYARAQLGDGPAALVAQLRRTQQPLAHGFGMNWVLHKRQGRDMALHEGGTGGFSSLVVLEPAAKRAVVVLADTALTDLGGLGDIGLALLGNEMPLQPRRAVEAPAALRQALVGDYELGPMRLKIWEADGKLMAQAAGQGAFELRHDSRGDFYPLGLSALLRPEPPEMDKPVARFMWHQMGGQTQARRVGLVESPPTITNAAWRDWAGEFQLAPQFSLKVFERDGQLMVQGSGQPAIAAEVEGKDRIAIKAVGAVVEFERNTDGQVIAAVLLQGGQRLRGARKP